MLAVFTASCACCRQPGPDLCRACRFSLASSPVVTLSHGVRAALSFDGAARSTILALKFRNRRAVAGHLASLIVRRLQLQSSSGGSFDLVTWAPTSRQRAGARGFDQAELIARHVARELGVPCRRLLYREHGSPQSGRSRSERLDGPSFRARRPHRPVRVLVVDDVVTTGATLHAAAASLRAAGVHDVCLVAAAATPDAGWPALRHLQATDPRTLTLAPTRAPTLAPVVSLEAQRARRTATGAGVGARLAGAPPGRLETA